MTRVILVGKTLKSGSCKTAIAACLIATTAPAQDAGGNGVTLGVSQNLNYSNNLDLNAAESSGVRARTGLNLTYSTATRFEGIQFNASSGLEFGSDDSSANGLIDPIFGLSYRREAKNAGITASANFRQSEVSSILGTAALIDAGFISIDNGLQTDLNYSLGLEFGRTDPIGGSISFSNNLRRYTDTEDPLLLDFDNRTLAAQINLRFDDRIAGRISGSLTEFVEDGGIRRNSTNFGVGATLAVSQTLSVDTSLSFNETERTDATGTTVTDGLGFSLSANQTLKGGSLSARLASSVNENGRRTTINVARAMELRNGNLSFSVGGVRGEDDGFEPTYSIGFDQELPRGAQVSVQASQQFQTSGDGNDAINTSVEASYSTPLTEVSSLQATANFRDTNGLDTSEDDASRLDLGLSYRHSLAQGWGLVGGYGRSFTSEDGEPDQTSDTVFVGLQKNFEWRP